MFTQSRTTPTAEEIQRVFEADYVQVAVRPDGTIAIQREDDFEVELASRSLKRGRTWYEGVSHV